MGVVVAVAFFIVVVIIVESHERARTEKCGCAGVFVHVNVCERHVQKSQL